MEQTYLVTVVSIVDSPPPSYHLGERTTAGRCVSAGKPWFVCANEVNHVDAGLKVSVGRDVLVMGGWCDVVGEAQAMVLLAKVHVDQTLIGTVKRDAPLSHSHHGIEVSHVGIQNHYTSVEQIWPADIWSRSKGLRQVEELLRSSVCDDISVNVDNLGEIGESP